MPGNVGSQQTTKRGPSQGQSMATDPVCGMKVVRGGQFRSKFEGQTYEFCSRDCKEQFDRDPERYASQRGDRDQADGGADDEM